jgi:catechol 2,3-dioxygenase-like lactoylglutathione lyase family enzyme
MARLPTPSEGILLTHFIVSDDVERSRRFYTEVLGGETVFLGNSSKGEPSIIALANGWVTINVGGGPTAGTRHRLPACSMSREPHQTSSARRREATCSR